MREKLIELQKTNCKTEKHCIDDCFGCMADHLIANGVTFAKDTNVPSWIPVTERLPVKRFFVLVFTSDKIVSEAIMDNDGKFYWANTDEDAEPLDVTHWMPLPEAPNGERRADD